MAERHGYWMLSSEINRRVGDRVYTRLRISIPATACETLRKHLLSNGNSKKCFECRIQGDRIVLTPVEQPKSKPRPISVRDRADQIIAIIEQAGGASTWPEVREQLNLASDSMPGPFVVRELRSRGVQSIRNPRTSTMIWKLTRKPAIVQHKLQQYSDSAIISART
jgi:hypothetical protein